VDRTLQQILPFRCLVQLVEHHERRILRPGEIANDLAIPNDVPAQVLAPIVEKRLGERRLTALTWPREQHHLFPEVSGDDWGQVPHPAILKPTLAWSSPF